MWRKAIPDPFYEKFMKEKEEKRYRDSLLHAVHIIDNKTPKFFQSFKIYNAIRDSKLQKLKEVEKSNQLLLRKMLSIDCHPSLVKANQVNRVKSNNIQNKNKDTTVSLVNFISRSQEII